MRYVRHDRPGTRPRASATFWGALVLATTVSAAPGDITTVAGGPGEGQATAFGLTPDAVAVSSDVLYVAERANNVVRAVDLATGMSTVIAGTGASGFSGDGGPAVAATFSGPAGIAVDGAGNVYVSDSGNNRIRRIDASGTITTVAGDGTRGYAGDGGPATTAKLNIQADIAVDAAGNLYIADFFNHRVRKVDAGGIITTVAGNGTPGGAGDGGPATSAELGRVQDVAVDGTGNLFIADFDNQRIRRVDALTGIITTIAGTGTEGFSGDGGPATAAQLSSPLGVAADAAGTVWIADNFNHRIRRVDALTNIITTVAGDGTPAFGGDGGPALAAQVERPSDVVLDGGGDLWIVDASRRVRRVDGGGTIDSAAGNGTVRFGGDAGPALLAQLHDPYDVDVDPGVGIWIADTENHRIRLVDDTGTISTVAGDGQEGFGGDGGPATAAQLSTPSGVVLLPDVALWIADARNNRVRRVDPSRDIATVAGDGTFGFGGDGGPATGAALAEPNKTAVDPDGTVWIADTENHRVRRVDPDGTITTVAGDGTQGAAGDGGPATQAQLAFPAAVTSDGAGTIWVADRSNHTVRRVDPDGIISTVAGDGTPGFGGDGGPATAAQLTAPGDVAVDGAGNLWVADTGNHRVRRVDAGGTITTVAGDGTRGFAGDGGPATSARLGDPEGIGIDGEGNLWIADTGNDRIRRVEGVVPPTTTTTTSSTTSTTSTITTTTVATPSSTSTTSSTSSSITITSTTLGPGTTTSTTLVGGRGLAGTRLLLKDDENRPARRRLQLVSKDRAALTLGDPADIPALIGQDGSLHVAAIGGDGFTQTYPLEASGWRLIKEKNPQKGVRYRSSTGPITKVVFKVGKRLVVQGKGEALTQTLADAPVTVVVQLRIGDRLFCLEFGGDKRAFRARKKLRRQIAPAPEVCPAP